MPSRREFFDGVHPASNNARSPAPILTHSGAIVICNGPDGLHGTILMSRQAAFTSGRREPFADRGWANLPGPFGEQIVMAINQELKTSADPQSMGLAARPRHAADSWTLKPSNGAQKPIDGRRMARIAAFLGEHIERHFTVADLAEVACMSPAHFARSFKATTGWCPHEFVRQIRLVVAKQLLADRHVPLSDIALCSGFSSQSNFSRAFRDATGMTPSAWRANSAVFE